MNRSRRPDALTRILPLALALPLANAAAPAPADDAAGPDRLALVLRARAESPGLGGACRVTETPASWDPKRTAAIVCDMWDLHHCLNAVRREVDMAPRMDQFLKALRNRGVLVIHAPSECMDAYKDHPARRRAREVPKSHALPEGIGQWCRQIPAEERGSYPVDQTNGGEDDDPAEHARWAARLKDMGRNPRAPWKSQTDLLTIDPEKDLISDNGAEIWSALEARGIDHVLLMGVHCNMCVLGRPFGLRQMAKNGKTVTLVRDLTDTMYDPRSAPYVSHFTGTDRVVEHVERYVCPSVTSDQVLGGAPFRFATDHRPRVVFLVAEDEYRTETTLPPYAAKWLGKDFAVSFVFDRADDKNALTGLGALDGADVLVVSARRRAFPADQLAKVRAHVEAGKAVVGIRTASHAFALRGNTTPPEGHAVWPGFDAEVLGGHYTNHHKEGPKVQVREAGSIDPELRRALLSGFMTVFQGAPTFILPGQGGLVGNGSLYKVSPLAPSAAAVLVGSVPGEAPEPLAWVNVTDRGGRVFYTSLGHRDDFAEPAFQRLLYNALTWASGREVPAGVEPSSLDPIAFPK